MTRTERILLPVAVFGALALAWELAVRVTGTAGLYPSPLGALRSGISLVADGTVSKALAGSLQRVLVGFAIGALIGIPIGLAMGLIGGVDRSVRPIFDALRSIAPIAWIPMAILWLGVRGDAALFVVAYAAVFPFIVNASQAAREVDRSYIAAAQALGAGPGLMLRSVILPSALPFVLTGARIAMAFAWGSIIAAELAIGIKVSGQGATSLGSASSWSRPCMCAATLMRSFSTCW